VLPCWWLAAIARRPAATWLANSGRDPEDDPAWHELTGLPGFSR